MKKRPNTFRIMAVAVMFLSSTGVALGSEVGEQPQQGLGQVVDEFQQSGDGVEEVPVEVAKEYPGPATPSSREADDPVSFGDDLIVVDDETGEVIESPSDTEFRAEQGYRFINKVVVNAYSYTVRIVNNPRAEQYRPILLEVANELHQAGLANLTIAPGRFASVASPGNQEIYFEPVSTSGCGPQSLGCTKVPGVSRATGRDYLANKAIVGILPTTDDRSAFVKKAVVAHEIGHALGLAHFDGRYQGVDQLMHPMLGTVNTYQAGDRSGLAMLARDIKPLGNLESVTVPSPGKIRTAGWSFSPNLNGPVRISISVDGKIIAERNADIQRNDVASAHQLLNSFSSGFDATYSVVSADHVVCLSTLNYPRSSYVQIGCKSITAKGLISADRLSGADRYSSAVEVSKAAFPGSAPVVFVASGTSFPDALAASPGAAALGGPLLLAQAGDLPAATRNEIIRLKPDRVVLIGETSTINAAVESQIKGLTKTVVRIAGANRYETSRLIASYAFPSALTTYIASGLTYADALSAGAAAATTKSPLLLVNGTSGAVDAATVNHLVRLKTTRVKVIGGTATVTAGIFNGLKAKVPNTYRISGADRFQGAVSISKDTYSSSSRAFVVTGMDYPEGLVAAPLSAKTKSPVYLSNGTCLHRSVLTDMNRLGVTRLTLIGGTTMLNTSVGAIKIC